jgi:hypothetical protein
MNDYLSSVSAGGDKFVVVKSVVHLNGKLTKVIQTSMMYEEFEPKAPALEWHEISPKLCSHWCLLHVL